MTGALGRKWLKVLAGAGVLHSRCLPSDRPVGVKKLQQKLRIASSYCSPCVRFASLYAQTIMISLTASGKASGVICETPSMAEARNMQRALQHPEFGEKMNLTKACPSCGAESFRFKLLSAFSDLPQECSACKMPAVQKTPKRWLLPLFYLVPFGIYILSSRARIYTGPDWIEYGALFLTAFVSIAAFAVYRAIAKLEKPKQAER
jgi:hypothetical protein